jgi:hypothetical protein
MLALALALSLTAAPDPGATAAPEPDATVAAVGLGAIPPPLRLAPPLDPGPFGSAELFGAAAGVVVADLAIAGAGYGTLLLFANDTFSPNATNFRRTAYALAFAALVGPPLSATLFGNWASPGPRGRLVRAWLVGFAAQVAAVFAGLAVAPHYWVALPAQLVAVTIGTTVGLHWGGAGPRQRSRADAPERPDSEPEHARATPVARAQAVCPIG